MRSFVTFDDAYRSVVAEVMSQVATPSRDGPARERTGVSFRVLDPRTRVQCRRMVAPYAAAELLWYLSWTSSGDMIKAYAPQYSRFLDQDGTANGAYGHRWRNQVQPLLELLRKDPDTRRAVLTAWKNDDVGRETPDQPCTLSLQFLVRDKSLHLMVNMRSNDAFLGFPYDAFSFSRLQWLFAQHLGLELGHYHHTVGSFHAYERDAAKLEAALATTRDPVTRRPYYVPIGEGRFFEAARAAVEFEQIIRTGKLADVEAYLREVVDQSFIGRTVLGECVHLCASKFTGMKADVVDATWY